LDKGFYEAARRCLFEYGEYKFETTNESTVENGSSKVDHVVLVNDAERVLVETKSPSVMAKLAELLPPHGIKLTWVRGQSLVPKILAKVSMPFPVGSNSSVDDMCIGCFVSGSKTDAVAVSHMPQLLDRVSPREA
jgi:hypothetical protein